MPRAPNKGQILGHCATRKRFVVCKFVRRRIHGALRDILKSLRKMRRQSKILLLLLGATLASVYIDLQLWLENQL